MEIEKLFIGNLNFEATEDGIRKLLSQYGTVVNIRLIRKKGHAVVEMSDRVEADAIIKNLDGIRFMERELRINYKLPSKSSRPESKSRHTRKEKSATDTGYSVSILSEKKSKQSGYKTASKPDRSGLSRNDSSDGYYSQSFRKRAQNSSKILSGNRSKNTSFERPDDFMKDEKGRDYRDLANASSRNGSGSGNRVFRNRNAEDNVGNRRGDDSGTRQRQGSSRGYGERARRDRGYEPAYSGVEGQGRYSHNRSNDDIDGNRRNPERKFSGERSRPASGNRSGNSSRRDGNRSSRPDSGVTTGRSSANRSRTSSRRDDSINTSPQKRTANREPGRPHNK